MIIADLGQDIFLFLAGVWDVLVFSLAGLVMVVGWVGMLVPAFPAGLVMWVAALLTGVNFGFGVWGWIIFSIITILVLIHFLIDELVFIRQAAEEGIPVWLIGVAMFLALILTFVFTPIVGILTPPVLLFGYEYNNSKDIQKAIRIFQKIFSGLGLTLIYRFVLGFVIVVLWAIWLLMVI